MPNTNADAPASDEPVGEVAAVQTEATYTNSINAAAPNMEAATTATASATAATTPNTDLVARHLPGLRERRLGAETIARFELSEVYHQGIAYRPGEFDGITWRPGTHRVLGTFVGQPRIRDLNEEATTTTHREPSFYLDPARWTEASRQETVYVVEDDGDVWTLSECGLKVLCAPDAAPEVVANFLRQHGGAGLAVTILSPGDAASRRRAARLHRACGAVSLVPRLRILDGAWGQRASQPPATVSELFARVQFSGEKLRAELDLLPSALPATVKAWANRDEGDGGESDTESDDMSFETGVPPAHLLPCYADDLEEKVELPGFAVEGLLLAGRPALLTGPYSAGKSLLALDWCLCAASGVDWNGRATRAGSTFLVASEGAGGTRKRKAGWMQVHGARMGVTGTPGFHVIPRAVQLHEPQALQSLIDTIRYYSRKCGQAPQLVVIDILAKCSIGLQENLPTDMTRLVECADAICQQTGAAVLLVHHTGRDGTPRGGGTLAANCDGHLMLTYNEAKGLVCLKVAKLKDFEQGETLALRLQPLTLPALLDAKGQPETTAVLVAATPGQAGQDAEGDVDYESVGSPENPTRGEWNATKAGAKASRGSQGADAEQASGDGPKSRSNGVALGGDGALSEKSLVTLQALRELCASEENRSGVASSQWCERALALKVSTASFDRAKKTLVAVGAGAPRGAGALCDRGRRGES